jgi:hypothetical protein
LAYENVACGQITVYDVLFVEVEHARRRIACHAHQRDERQLLLFLDLRVRVRWCVCGGVKKQNKVRI